MDGTPKSITVKASLTAAVASLLLAAPALADGGVAAPGDEPAPAPRTVPGPKAKLLANGKAIPPKSAPRRIKRAIWAANSIRHKPYLWGGGHSRWRDRGYDCSGAVSYVLHAARLLRSPLASGGLMRWGNSRRRGRWITVYANRGHVYAVIAGLRWDTSSAGDSRSQGKGPRWRYTKRSPRGYVRRSWRGF